MGLGWVIKKEKETISWGLVIRAKGSQKRPGEDSIEENCEEHKFLLSLGIYELEILALHLAIQILNETGHMEQNLIAHCDNVGTCYSVRKGAGTKTFAMACIAKMTQTVARTS